MALPYETFKARIVEIENQSDSNSKYYAKVLRWKHNPRDQYHYGIGLSDLKICSLEEDFLIIERSQVDAIIDPHVDPLFTNTEIIERLKFTLRCLRDCEEFSFNTQNLNDEHLANLIIIGLAKASITQDILPRNITAEQNFRAYLDNDAPNLKKGKKLAFALKASKSSTWTYVFCFIIFFTGAFFLAQIEAEFSRFIAAIIGGVLGVFFARLMLKISSFNWSGFYDKRLWDWLDLLFVPFFLALGAFYIENQANTRSKNNLQRGSELQIISKYIEEINDLIVKKNNYSDLPSIPKEKETIAKAMTINLLDRIDYERQPKIFSFLSDAFLINCPNSLDPNCDPVIHLEGVNLTRIKLSNLTLPNIILNRANLSNAEIKNTILNNAKLRNANLSETTLVEVKLINADLRSAYLHDANFSEYTNLQNANLSKADLSESDLSGVNLRGADLSGVNLQKADLSNADLRDVNLRCVEVREDKLRCADLRGADLSGADLQKADLSGANLKETINLKSANLKDTCYNPETTTFPDDFVEDDIKKQDLRELRKNENC